MYAFPIDHLVNLITAKQKELFDVVTYIKKLSHKVSDTLWDSFFYLFCLFYSKLTDTCLSLTYAICCYFFWIQNLRTGPSCSVFKMVWPAFFDQADHLMCLGLLHAVLLFDIRHKEGNKMSQWVYVHFLLRSLDFFIFIIFVGGCLRI